MSVNQDKRQQDDSLEDSNIWNTDRINEILRKADEEGLDFKSVDNPFHDNNPEFKRANILFEYTKDELLEIQKCAQDVIYFSKYCQVMTDEGLAYIRLRDYQKSVLMEFQANRFNIFLAPRQVGKSIMSSVFLVWYLLFNHDKNAMILANVGSTSEELMDKIKAIIKGLPFFLKPGMMVNNVMSMRFDNGCRVMAKTTTKTSGIGFTIHFLYMDEFAHINPSFMEAFFRSTYPTVSSSKVSRIIITSTPNGMNKFYDMYMDAINGVNTFNPIRVDWWQVPGRDDVWKQNEIANLGSEELFNQEYGNQFLSSSTLLLGRNELEIIRNNSVEYAWREISDFHYADVNYENFLWHPKFDLDSVPDRSKMFVLSVDLSGGNRGDFTVINVFKVTPLPKTTIEKIGEYYDESDFFGLLQVGVFRDNEAKLEDVVKILRILVKNILGIENTKIALEVNYKGELLVDKVLADEDLFEEIFIYTKHTEASRISKVGIKYNEKNKMKNCEELRNLTRAGRILINDKRWTVPELFTFGLNSRGTYSSQTGHDDVAMTLVNLPSCFESGAFYQLVGEMFDSMEGSYKNIILNKMGENDSNSSDPFSPGTKPNYSKDAKGFSDFNSLL
jgi:hypothetical protein